MRFSKQISLSKCVVGLGLSLSCCLLFVLLFLLSFLGVSSGMAKPMEKPHVFFTAPADKANVSSPVKVTMGAEAFTIEPAGVVKEGAGHLHIMIDTDCITAGQLVPKDATHLHYGKGQTEAEIELPTGSHILCLQAADGAHIALTGDGMTHTISITVK
jgi:hypothetical protein